MKVALRRVGAATLTALALILVPTCPATVAAQSSTAQSTAASAPRTSTKSEPRFVKLSIDSVTPTAVTTTSEPVVTVSGTVSNVGDRAVEDVSVRLQRAPAVTKSVELRTSLTLDQTGFDTVGPFVTVAAELAKGEARAFTLTLPLRSATKPSLDITKPGVYPLLVNVNGAPAYGAQARLDDARFLLPVLGLPSTAPAAGVERPPQTRSPSSNLSAGTAVAPDTSSPVAVTMMWPLADKPHLVAGIPGSTSDKVRLRDDELATSLAKGGRLEELLAAVEFATGGGVDPDHRLADSLCLAIDPDLLVTVANMTRGYLVVQDPADPTGAARDGSGRNAAIDWLGRLRTLAATMCTTAVPFAQVDLAALTTVDNPSLIASALKAPADIIDGILGITSVRNLTWPDSGVLTENDARTLQRLAPTTTLLAATAVDVPVGNTTATSGGSARVPTGTSPETVQIAGSGTDGLVATLFDVSAAGALAAVGGTPQTPSYLPENARYDLEDDSRTARLQDALGALTWSSLHPPEPRTPPTHRSMLFVPPQQWSADGSEADAVLSMMSTLIRTGLANPRPLTDRIGRQPEPPDTAELTYPDQALLDDVPASIVSVAADQAPRLDTLLQALVDDPQANLTSNQFIAPLREDLLRAMSLSGRRDANRDAAERAAQTRVTEVSDAVDGMFGGVTVLSPGGVYTLASEQSPLLLVARNDLAVGIMVRLHVDAPPEMKITDIGPTQLPPRGSRTLTVPAQISDSRKLVVAFGLTTETGQQLGEPTRVTVRSNAYGQVLAIITGCAGALLLFLAGRRLLHRFRGEPDPADEGHERP